MKKPTLQEVKDYAKSIGITLDVERWYLQKEEFGWRTRVGNRLYPISNWKASIQLWAAKNISIKPKTTFRDRYEENKNEK